jgi:YfiR/HmsC-like
MAQNSNRWLRRTAIGAAALVLAAASAFIEVEAGTQVAEYDLKAALVYRTAKFIEWPNTAFAAPKSSFVVCIVGDNAAAVASFRALETKTIGTRPIVVRRINGDMLDLRQCHAAYFPADTADDISYAADKLQSAPVLTVGDTKRFIEHGGMLALVVNPERVSFLIHLPATKRAQLGVSSQLLQLATVLE